MRRTEHQWISALVFASVIAGPAMAAKTTPSDWSDENGAQTASKLIADCLAPPLHGRGRAGGIECATAPFDVCTRENGGNDTQVDINECMRFSRRAWGARYDGLVARVEASFARWSREPPRPWVSETKRRFRPQEDDWQRWMKADCEMVELGSVEGTAHSANVAGCEVQHLASRTLDLTQFLDWLETR